MSVPHTIALTRGEDTPFREWLRETGLTRKQAAILLGMSERQVHEHARPIGASAGNKRRQRSRLLRVHLLAMAAIAAKLPPYAPRAPYRSGPASGMTHREEAIALASIPACRAQDAAG